MDEEDWPEINFDDVDRYLEQIHQSVGKPHTAQWMGYTVDHFDEYSRTVELFLSCIPADHFPEPQSWYLGLGPGTHTSWYTNSLDEKLLLLTDAQEAHIRDQAILQRYSAYVPFERYDNTPFPIDVFSALGIIYGGITQKPLRN